MEIGTHAENASLSKNSSSIDLFNSRNGNFALLLIRCLADRVVAGSGIQRRIRSTKMRWAVWHLHVAIGTVLLTNHGLSSKAVMVSPVCGSVALVSHSI